MKEHLEHVDIERLFREQLTEEESESTLAHLSECTHCFQRSEEVWDGLASLGLETPPMAGESRGVVEDRLFRSIHLASLGSNLAWLVTDGFARVIVALLWPLAAARSASDSERT